MGNLICYRGAVISQTGRHLDCFEQVEVLRADSQRQLAIDPADFEALRTLGEIAYNEGRLAEAVELLRRAYQSEPADLRTIEVLGEALVAALDEEFAEYQDLLPLLAEIQRDSPADQLTLARLQSQGLLEIGQAAESFEVCVRAYEDFATMGAELSIGRKYRVSAQRWLSAQSGAAWAAASQTQREQIATRFEQLLEQTTQVGDENLSRQFYDCFSSLELAAPLGLEIATSYLERGEIAAAQQILLSLATSDDLVVRRAAIANNSRLLHEADQPFLAATYDEMLRGPLANEECLPGLTGTQCLAEWANRQEPSVPDWPYGRVDVAVEETKLVRGSSGSRSPNTGVSLERSDGVLGGCNVTLLGMTSGRNRAVTVRDSIGARILPSEAGSGFSGNRQCARRHLRRLAWAIC